LIPRLDLSAIGVPGWVTLAAVAFMLGAAALALAAGVSANSPVILFILALAGAAAPGIVAMFQNKAHDAKLEKLNALVRQVGDLPVNGSGDRWANPDLVEPPAGAPDA
jgi:hypothetical protein